MPHRPESQSLLFLFTSFHRFPFFSNPFDANGNNRGVIEREKYLSTTIIPLKYLFENVDSDTA